MQCLWTVQCNHIFVTLTKVKQIYWDFIYHKCKYWFDIIQIIIFNFIPTIYNLHTYENHWFMLGPDQNAVLFYFAQFLKRFDEFLHSVNCSGCSIVFFIDEKKPKIITVHVLMWYVVIWLITYTSQVPCTCIGYVCVISHDHFTNSLFNNTTKYIVCPGNDIMKHFLNFPNFNHS